MPELQDVQVVAEGLSFPEGPVAMPDGSVIVVEISAGRVSRVEPGGHVSIVAETGGGPNGAAIGPDGGLYVCNSGGIGRAKTAAASIQRIDLQNGAVDVLYTSCDGRDLGAPNDLVFDNTGWLYFTDLAGAALYYASTDGTSIRQVVQGASAPNGVGLSPGQDVLYWAETFTRQVHRRRLEGPGQVVESARHSVGSLMSGLQPDAWTLVVGLPGRQELDSLAVDASGAICVGTLVDSGVTVIDPETGGTETHTLPDELSDGAVTNICFGGPDMRTAYITCSITGRLVSARWPRQGLKLAFQQLPSSV